MKSAEAFSYFQLKVAFKVLLGPETYPQTISSRQQSHGDICLKKQGSDFYVSTIYHSPCTKACTKINYSVMSVLLLLTWSFQYECSCPSASIRRILLVKTNLNSHFKSKECNLIGNMILSKSKDKNIFRNLYHTSMNTLLRKISLMSYDWENCVVLLPVLIYKQNTKEHVILWLPVRGRFIWGIISPIWIRSIMIVILIISRLRTNSWKKTSNKIKM